MSTLAPMRIGLALPQYDFSVAGGRPPRFAASGPHPPPPGQRGGRSVRLSDPLLLALSEDGGSGPRAGGVSPLLPLALQQPRPRVFVGGKGDRLLRIAAERADGWNACWVWTPPAYRERRGVVDDACERIGRDTATMWRTLGLYALYGEDEPVRERRFD